jgi:hypothetical protein
LDADTGAISTAGQAVGAGEKIADCTLIFWRNAWHVW